MQFIQVLHHSYWTEIILNRPEVRNAFHPQMIDELKVVFQKVPMTSRVILLRGAGASFCAGADLTWMKSMVDYSFEENLKDSTNLFEMFAVMSHCAVPIVTVVHGHAMGGALGLLACSDAVIVEDQTQFCFSEVRLGIVPGVISSFVLRKTLPNISRLYMMSGEVFKADVAVRMGLAHETVSGSELAKRGESWVQRFVEVGPEAVRTTKKFLNKIAVASTQDEIRSFTIAAIAERRVSAEGQEGLKAFLEKRTPQWKGQMI